MEPRVSVLIAAYNHAEFLPGSLAGVLAQTVRPSQVIVINDGSTDDTERLLQAYDGRIEYIRQPNQGKPRALNVAMQRVTGEYVWIMDDDDVALPDVLERHLGILERSPEVGFTYSSYYWAEGGKIRLFTQPDQSDPEFFLRLLQRRVCVLFQGMLVRTSCYREVGPFDPELWPAEDWDMFIRLSRRFVGALIAGPTIFYRWHWGLRGPAYDRYPTREAILRGIEYDKKVLQKARGETPLHCYLPRTAEVASTLTTCDTRRALFQRASIMAFRNLHKEMIEDLRLASALPGDSALSLADRRILWDFPWCHFKCPKPWVLRRNREVLQNASAIAKSKAPRGSGVAFDVTRDLARGLYWQAIQAWRENDRLHAIVLLFSACRIIGARGILEVGFRKALGLRMNRPQLGIEVMRSNKELE